MSIRCKIVLLLAAAALTISVAGCGGGNQPRQVESPATPVYDAPTFVARPASITEMSGRRGDQDKALPELRIDEPRPDSVIKTSTVKVKVELGGILKGFELSSESEITKGNHIRVFLDDDRHGEIRGLDEPFEFRDVANGVHTIAVVPVRPWGESFKNDGALQMVRFSVRNETGAIPETVGEKERPDVDNPLIWLVNPLLDGDREQENPVMIDFALANVRLSDRGGNYRIGISVNGGAAQYFDKLEPVWISGLRPGPNRILIELTDRNGKVVRNGRWNSIQRDFKVVR